MGGGERSAVYQAVGAGVGRDGGVGERGSKWTG